jgi:uncharacterized SAM-binding protein YcdF (DUF218 family)
MMKRLVYPILAICLFLPACAIVAPLLGSLLIVQKPLAKADCILILSGSAAHVERVDEASALFNAGVAPQIFLTDDGQRGGWDERTQKNPYFVELAVWRLMQNGVPQDSIVILPGAVAGTADEANIGIVAASERGVRSMLLVTSAYHSRRALSAFDQAKIREQSDIQIGMISPASGDLGFSGHSWRLNPSSWSSVGSEWVKLVYYWVRY